MRSGHTWHLVFALLLLLPAIAFAEASDTKSEEESRGQHRVGLGLMGLAVPGVDLYAGGGFLLRWTYEKGPLALLGDLRAAGRNHDGDIVELGSIGAGGRWFVWEATWTPLLGAGLSAGKLRVKRIDGFRGSTFGFGGWLEAGLALLRGPKSYMTFESAPSPCFSKCRANGCGSNLRSRKCARAGDSSRAASSLVPARRNRLLPPRHDGRDLHVLLRVLPLPPAVGRSTHSACNLGRLE